MNEPILTQHLQDCILYLSIVNDKFANLVVAKVKPDLFSSDITREVYKVIFSFVTEFKKAPGDHFNNELMSFLEQSKAKEDIIETAKRYILHLSKLPPPDIDYVVKRLSDFIQLSVLRNAAYEFAEHIDSGDLHSATGIMQKALKEKFEPINAGTDYTSDYNDIDNRGDRPERLFKLGIPYLDKYLRIERSDLITIAGARKGTKSWFCHHIARQAVLDGLMVVHVSHENSLKNTLQRYDMMFGYLLNTDRPEPIEIRWMEDGRTLTETRMVDTIYNKELVKQIRSDITQWGGQLVVKKFAMGSCNPAELDSFCDTVEDMYNRRIDVLINDYADIMAPFDKQKQTRDSINETYIYSKRIADDRDLALFTPSQINEEGAQILLKTGRMSGEALAEDKRKFANIDKGVYVGIPTEREQYNEAIVGIFANRNDYGQGYHSIIGQNLRIGQFCIYNYI
jgi:hypothetical protein